MNLSAASPSVDETSVESAPGVTIDVTRWSRGRRSAVVLAPGFFRSRRSPMMVAAALRLAAAHDVYAFDFRGHGSSGGRYTFGRHEDQDFRAVLAHVRARDHERIAVVGFSMGGTVAVRAIGAARREGSDLGVAALATVSSPTEVIRLRPWRPPRGLLAKSLADERHALPRVDPRSLLGHRLDTLAHAPWVAPTPLLVMHNVNDWLVPHRMAEALFAAAREPRSLHIFQNHGRHHADALVRSLAQELFGVLEPFLAAALGS